MVAKMYIVIDVEKKHILIDCEKGIKNTVCNKEACEKVYVLTYYIMTLQITSALISYTSHLAHLDYAPNWWHV